MSDMKATVLSDTHDFELLKEEWNSLHEKSESCSVFLSWEWLFSWWKEFHNRFALYIIVVRNHSGELVGIAPLCIKKRWNSLPFRVLTFLGSSYVSSEYLDIISRPDCEPAVVSEIFKMIHSNAGGWDCIKFTDALESSLCSRLYTTLSLTNKYVVEKTVAEECSYLKLADNKDDMLSRFSGSLKSTIKRRSKKLEKKGAVVDCLDAEGMVEPCINRLFDLHQKRWNSIGIKGNFRDKAIKSFHTEVSNLLLNRALLKLYTLTVDEKAIAVLYTFEFKGTLFYFQSGYDPDSANFSPGTVLMWRCICDAIDRGVTQFDFLRGPEYYKSLWADSVNTTYSMLLIPSERVVVLTFFKLLSSAKKLKLAIKDMLW